DIVGDIHVEAGQVRIGIEQFKQVLAPQYGREWACLVDGGEILRAGACKVGELVARSSQCFDGVGKRVGVIFDVDPVDPCACGVVFAIAVAASETLHHGGPRGELGDERSRGNVYTGLDGLGSDDDAIGDVLLPQLTCLLAALFCAETCM